jgi:hypothetical protein
MLNGETMTNPLIGKNGSSHVARPLNAQLNRLAL